MFYQVAAWSLFRCLDAKISHYFSRETREQRNYVPVVNENEARAVSNCDVQVPMSPATEFDQEDDEIEIIRHDTADITLP